MSHSPRVSCCRWHARFWLGKLRRRYAVCLNLVRFSSPRFCCPWEPRFHPGPFFFGTSFPPTSPPHPHPSEGFSPRGARCRAVPGQYCGFKYIDMLAPCCKAPDYNFGMQMNPRSQRRGSAVALGHLPTVSHRSPRVCKEGVGRAVGSPSPPLGSSPLSLSAALGEERGHVLLFCAPKKKKKRHF